MGAVELAAGGAYRVRLAGSKRTDPVLVEKVEDGQVSFRLTWMSKGERVVSPKLHVRSVGEVEVIGTLDLDRFVWKPGEIEVQKAEPVKAEEPKAKRPRGRRPRRERFIAYEVEPWSAVMPWGLLGEEDPQAFRRRFRHRLHRLTPRILAELAELLAKYDGWPLALLCFERDPADCHRVRSGGVATGEGGPGPGTVVSGAAVREHPTPGHQER